MIVTLVLAILLLPPVRILDALGIEMLHWLDARVMPAKAAPQPVVSIVAFDEETYRREPFKELPQALWTPYLAPVLKAVLAGGATVVGLDVVFAISGDGIRRGYDQDWLATLRAGSRDGRVVLGRVQHQQQPIQPTRAQLFAVGHDRNLRANNLVEDPDGVIRRAPFGFTLVSPDGSRSEQPSLSVELAARALHVEPARTPGGALMLGDRRIADAGGGSLLLRFDPDSKAVPIHSLADLAACAEAGRTDYFDRWFKGRIVLIGAVLDVEDRKLTSARYITEPDGSADAPRCILPAMDGLHRADLRRDSIPGVLVHAAAIDNLLRGTPLQAAPAALDIAVLALSALTVALLAMWLTPVAAASALPVLWLGWVGISLSAFESGLLLPLLRGLLAPAIAVPLATIWRHGVTERERRRIGHAFSLYLPEGVIAKLMHRGSLPELGGEQRDCTVLFTDIAGFTGMAEAASPQHVVATMNDYFGAVSDIIDRHGGFIDKFIGDAVMAVFGGLDDDSDHAARAVRAGIEIRALENAFGLDENRRFVTRIGIHTGPVVIGNIGSARRFNYTVLGDVVNAASRVEGVNKYYGTRLMVTDATRAGCGDEVIFREITRVRVMNRAEPLLLYEPIDFADKVDAAARQRLTDFDAAMDAWRRGDFATAEAGFRTLGRTDLVARRYAGRAEDFRLFPPKEWDGVTDLDGK